jgi:peptidoglycan/LPS O-acetylase OafA/YrhL
MKSLNINYIPAIDHLRAFAALLIFFYHGITLIGYQLKYNEPFTYLHWNQTGNPLLALLYEGHTAVSLFMVLSGFIFTIGAYQSQLRYGDFIRNRFLRTYPLFVLMLIVGTYAFADRFSMAALLQTLLFMGNLPGAANAGSFASMFWAVAVEWQFYLVFPFLMLFVNRHGIRYALGLLLLFVLLRSGATALGASPRDIGYWSILGRMDQFLLGMAAGVIYRRHFQAGAKFDVLFFVSLVFVLALMQLFNGTGGWPGNSFYKVLWPTVEGLGWAAFILGYLSIARWLPAIISKGLVAIGTVSYSIYLIHFVVIDICIRQHLYVAELSSVPSANALATSLLLLPVVLLMAALSWHIVEKPFLGLRKTYLRRDMAEPDSVQVK